MIELEQYQTDVANVRQQILTAGEALQVGHMREQIDELSEEMNQPEFWNDLERSTKVNQKLGHLKNRLNHYEKLLSTADDIEVMISLAKEENDESMVQEVGTELQKLKEQADALELETLMRGDYDRPRRHPFPARGGRAAPKPRTGRRCCTACIPVIARKWAFR